MKGSGSEQFEQLYRRIWGALNRADDPDLSQHERQLLHRVPADGAVSLTWLAEHLGLPKSTASMAGKRLGPRGVFERAPGKEDGTGRALRVPRDGAARAAGRTR